jgi:peptide/nickel transport system substrate-binding protein
MMGKGFVIVAAAIAGLAGVAAPAQAAKDTLVLGMVLEPPHLDPTAGAAAAIDEVVYANLFEGLTRVDRTGTVQPALAESWTISGDGLVYTFTLRQGVKFHDGTAFDCSIVKFSYDRAVAEDSVNAQKGLFAPIAATACPDPSTAVVTLKLPTSTFLFSMGWGDAVMVAPDTAAENKTNPVGTGPFKMKQWVKGDRVELARNDGYWGTPAALTSVTFKFIADASAAVAAMMAGDVDAFPNFPAAEALAAFRADPRFAVRIGTTEGETILALNNTRKPFDDVRVRRALAYAIDRQEIVDGAMSGLGTPIGSHFAPHSAAYVDMTSTYPHDAAKAKALLAEAGYADGFSTSIVLPPPPYARRGGEVIAAQLAKVGVKAELVPMEWAQWLDNVFKQSNFDMSIVSHTEPMDIDIYARDKYYFNYQDAGYKALYQKFLETTDPAARILVLHDIQRKLAEDEPNVFLFQLAKVGVWNAKLQGLWESSPVQANDVTEAHWAE